MNSEHDRFRGCLLGLACGDAVGATVEFRPRGTFPPVTDMTGGGPFHLEPGQWTDDTSMALCLASSLIETGDFDPRDQMERYWRWYSRGELSSTGYCFDIGNATQAALLRFHENGEPYSGSTHPHSAGNGCLMRLAPVPMYAYPDLSLAIQLSGDSARTTHAAPECVQASQFFGAILHQALAGLDQNTILFDLDFPAAWTAALSPRLNGIVWGDYRDKTEDGIHGGGYVVECLEAALWCFHQTSDFREAILKAVNLGDDADTTAAVCGQLAGAFYGTSGIPEPWRRRLARHDLIVDLADSLWTLRERTRVRS